MDKKKMFGILMAGAVALSLLPTAALAADWTYVRQRITESWDSYMLLYPGEDGEGGWFLMPSEYDAEHYRLVEGTRGSDDTVRAEYDDRGNLTSLIFRSSVSVRTQTWSYDSQGREIRAADVLVLLDEDQGDEVFWDNVTETVYDSQGRMDRQMVTSDDMHIVRQFIYDDQGRKTEERIEADGAPSVTEYAYEGDRLILETYEGDGVRYETRYTYNEAGLLSEQTGVRSDYAGDGQFAETGGSSEYYAYDGEGRLVNRKYNTFQSDRAVTYSDEIQLRFDDAGRLVRQEETWENPGEGLGSRDCSVRYDEAGRVSEVTANGVIHTYSYDEAGNNTQIAIRGEGVDAFTIAFTYEPVDAGPAPQPAPAFSDVAADAYYAGPVAWAVEAGVTSGTSETTFSPDDPCTRAQVVTFLWRAFGGQEAAAPGVFTDVEPGSYYEKAVAWALEKGITGGTSETTFSPDATCTRAQVVTFLHRAMGEPEAADAANPFADVGPDDYFLRAVLWARDREVTGGTSDTAFSPADPCTRAQVVTFLYRTLEGPGA